MATFHDFDGLLDAVADRNFDRPPAVVANAHVTGLGVARALEAHDVPVIAVDRTGRGVAPYSTAVDVAGRVSYPLDDRDAFGADLEAIAAELGHEPVAFGCMDEWVHGLAGADPEGVALPFSDRETIDAVLDKFALYEAADRLGVPYPETHRLDRTDPGEAAELLGFPMVIKPALKRTFEELVGTNVIEVADLEELEDVVANARDAGVRIMGQEKVPKVEGKDRSLASYRSPDGEVLGVVGNARVRHPRGYGTSSLVERVEDETIRARAVSVLADADYYGISEAEFVYDGDRGEHVLLDVNTRPWKWIGLPVAAGANLPVAAYADATGATYDPGPLTDARWVSLTDYLRVLAGEEPFRDRLSRSDWRSLVSGAFEREGDLTTAVYEPSEPGPAAQLIRTETGDQEYYCAC